MKLQVFAVLDKAVQAYLPPFFARAKGEAVRSFSEASNDEKHNFRRHSADYVLYFLGEFDDGAGIFNCSEPVRIISSLECLVEDPFTADKEIAGDSLGSGAPQVKRRLPM